MDINNIKNRQKSERIVRFGKALPRMRRMTAKHLRSNTLDDKKVLACVVRLMEQTYIRMGNERYAGDNLNHGITAFRRKHTLIENNTIIFDFNGAKPQPQRRIIKNHKLANIVHKLEELPGASVFKYYDESGTLTDIKNEELNAYITQVMGEAFTVQDFRAWGATLLATTEFVTIKKVNKLHARKKAVSKCIKNVAKKLGSTAAVTRQRYIDPRVIATFMSGDKLSEIYTSIRKLARTHDMSDDERCVLALLETAPIALPAY